MINKIAGLLLELKRAVVCEKEICDNVLIKHTMFSQFSETPVFGKKEVEKAEKESDLLRSVLSETESCIENLSNINSPAGYSPVGLHDLACELEDYLKLKMGEDV